MPLVAALATEAIPVSGNEHRDAFGPEAGGYCRKPEVDAMLLRAGALRLNERDAEPCRNGVDETESEADRLLEQPREYRHLASKVAGDTGVIIHVWASFADLAGPSKADRMNAAAVPLRVV